MKRQEFSTRVRDEAYQRCGGKCESCGADLAPGRYQFDHIVPAGLGGAATLENCAVLCRNCHSNKTHNVDRPRMAKADRGRKKHLGIKKLRGQPMPGTKASGWKRLMSGEWVRREGK